MQFVFILIINFFINHRFNLKIKSIKIKLYIENPGPVAKNYGRFDAPYVRVNWEKLIYPKNL